jgi:hypothetical protein
MLRSLICIAGSSNGRIFHHNLFTRISRGRGGERSSELFCRWRRRKVFFIILHLPVIRIPGKQVSDSSGRSRSGVAGVDSDFRSVKPVGARGPIPLLPGHGSRSFWQEFINFILNNLSFTCKLMLMLLTISCLTNKQKTIFICTHLICNKLN